MHKKQQRLHSVPMTRVSSGKCMTRCSKVREHDITCSYRFIYPYCNEFPIFHHICWNFPIGHFSTWMTTSRVSEWLTSRFFITRTIELIYFEVQLVICNKCENKSIFIYAVPSKHGPR